MTQWKSPSPTRLLALLASLERSREVLATWLFWELFLQQSSRAKGNIRIIVAAILALMSIASERLAYLEHRLLVLDWSA